MEVLHLPMPAGAHVIIIIIKLHNNETRNDCTTRVSPLPLRYADVAVQRRPLTIVNWSQLQTFWVYVLGSRQQWNCPNFYLAANSSLPLLIQTFSLY